MSLNQISFRYPACVMMLLHREYDLIAWRVGGGMDHANHANTNHGNGPPSPPTLSRRLQVRNVCNCGSGAVPLDIWEHVNNSAANVSTFADLRPFRDRRMKSNFTLAVQRKLLVSVSGYQGLAVKSLSHFRAAFSINSVESMTRD
jgi:hypothetical protein